MSHKSTNLKTLVSVSAPLTLHQVSTGEIFPNDSLVCWPALSNEAAAS